MGMTDPDQLQSDVQKALGSGPADDAALEAVLTRLLERLGCVAGTIHRLNPASGLLELAAARGIPEAVRQRAARVPIGKGMGGIAAERRAPVQVCNLQTDESGVARPAARETPVEGAIAVPMLVEGALRGVLGVAKATAYEFSDDEVDLLLRAGELIGRSIPG
jgi:L-methionine (R)-S-oxide reductase